MKRIFCLLAAMTLLLCSCGSEPPFFVKEIDDLTDFHCCLTHGDDSVVLHGDDAKAAYHLITDTLRILEDSDDSPSGDQIGAVFYVGDVNPLSDTVPFEQQYGDYSVWENGIGLYVASVSASSGFNYQVGPSVYTSLLKMI